MKNKGDLIVFLSAVALMLIVTIAGVSCGTPITSLPITELQLIANTHKCSFYFIKIDSCTFILSMNDMNAYPFAFTHSPNCSNPIHRK